MLYLKSRSRPLFKTSHRRTVIVLLCAFYVVETLVLTSCSGLPAQSPTAQITSQKSKSLLRKEREAERRRGSRDRVLITSTSLPRAIAGVPYSAILMVSGGKAPYSWSTSSGSLPQGLMLDSATGTVSGRTTQSGDFSFQANVTDSALQSATRDLRLQVSSATDSAMEFDGPAELPRVYVKSPLADTPAPGRTVPVNAGNDLQSALNGANCGDTLELQAGATFSGRYVLPAKACDDEHWIIIRTSAPDIALPPEGVRLTPCYAGVAGLPGRPALNCTTVQNVLPKILFPGNSGSGPLRLASGANHYRLLGLEVTRATGTGKIGGLLEIQQHGAADHIVVDRVWMHGTARDETGHGIHLNGATYFAVVDSYLSDFHCISVTGACTDAQAIVGGSGAIPSGAFKIVGNFLEASGENILFGGGPATVTPLDIEIRRNHLFKPLQWMRGTAGFVGGNSGNPFVVKNHFELKNAQRVLFEGNVLQNTWGGFSQSGFSILLTPKNQSLNGTNVCPVCQVTDVTIRYATISHVGAGFQIATVPSDSGGMALAGARLSIHDITVDDISARRYTGAGTLVTLFNDWSRNVLHDVSLDHITGFPDPAHHVLTLLDVAPNPAMSGLRFTNSILGAASYPVWSAGGGSNNCAYSNIPVTSLSTCFDTYIFADNALIGSSDFYLASKWPSGNYFLSAASNVQFVNYTGGDYHLLPTSPCKNAASDGKDLGADIEAIRTATFGVY